MNTNLFFDIINIFKSFVDHLYIRFNKPRMGVNSRNSHYRKDSGKPKIPFSKEEANRETIRYHNNGVHVNSYDCPKCDKHHVGHRNDFSKIGGFHDIILIATLFGTLYELYQRIIKILHK